MMNTQSKASIVVDAILFDMDGTLIDSTPGVLKAWDVWAKEYNLGPGADIAHKTHGRRLYDTLKELCGIEEESRLQAEIVKFEEAVIEGGPLILPGVKELLKQLEHEHIFGWTIVTSATNVYAPRALNKCGVVLPPAGYVTSNDVPKGKPFPDPYLAGADKCGVDPTKCLVIEDALSGLKAGRAAGSKTLAVCTSTDRGVIVNSGVNPDFIVKDLTRVSVKWTDNGKIEVVMDQSID